MVWYYVHFKCAGIKFYERLIMVISMVWTYAPYYYLKSNVLKPSGFSASAILDVAFIIFPLYQSIYRAH